MATISITTGRSRRSHEEKAEDLRKLYGENTIVWFTRPSHYAIYGEDAELTAKLFGIVFDYTLYNNEFVAYMPKDKYDWMTIKAIVKGYKIAILQD